MADLPPTVRDRMDDLDEDDDGEGSRWDNWARESSPAERTLAESLQDAEPGDPLRLDPTFVDGAIETEVRYVDRRPGVLEVRCTAETTWWVIRKQWVFVTDRDADTVFIPSWKGLEALEFDADSSGR